MIQRGNFSAERMITAAERASFFQRQIIGGLFDRMAAVLWVIAVVSTLTVIHRIVYTWQETRAGRTLPGIKISL